MGFACPTMNKTQNKAKTNKKFKVRLGNGTRVLWKRWTRQTFQHSRPNIEENCACKALNLLCEIMLGNKVKTTTTKTNKQPGGGGGGGGNQKK